MEYYVLLKQKKLSENLTFFYFFILKNLVNLREVIVSFFGIFQKKKIYVFLFDKLIK